MTTTTEVNQFRDWKLFVSEGVIFVILGLVALSIPELISVTLTFLLGWLLIIGGVTQVIFTFRAETNARFLIYFISGLIIFVCGVLLLTRPAVGAIALSTIFAVYLLIQGIFQIILAISLRKVQGWLWLLCVGILAILLSLSLWYAWPVTMIKFIGLIIGAYLLVWGIADIVIGLALKKAKDTKP